MSIAVQKIDLSNGMRKFWTLNATLTQARSWRFEDRAAIQKMMGARRVNPWRRSQLPKPEARQAIRAVGTGSWSRLL